MADIEFIVENGTNVAGANSYVTLAYFNTYCTVHGDDISALSDEAKKVLIIKGTEFVDNFFLWKGSRKYTSQPMAFPRNGIYDRNREEVTGIPEGLKKAVCEASFIAKSKNLWNTKSRKGDVSSEAVSGAVSVSYFQNEDYKTNNAGTTYTSVYESVNILLRGLYKTSDSGICVPVKWSD
jgi:hypothetical protein